MDKQLDFLEELFEQHEITYPKTESERFIVLMMAKQAGGISIKPTDSVTMGHGVVFVSSDDDQIKLASFGTLIRYLHKNCTPKGRQELRENAEAVLPALGYTLPDGWVWMHNGEERRIRE